MYNAHKITDKVAAGKLAIGSHVGFDSPFVTEMIAGCGFDFIWIDGEHSAIDRKDIQNHLMACRAAGAAGIVRVPWNDPVIIKAILDMGADGIVVPLTASGAWAPAGQSTTASGTRMRMWPTRTNISSPLYRSSTLTW